MRMIIFMAATLASLSLAEADPILPIICVNEERVEKIICPVVVVNEEVKKCECPEGMTPVDFEPESPHSPPKASGG